MSDGCAATGIAQEMVRRVSGKALILQSLIAAGAEGCTNRELNSISFRYGARLMELRRAGHDIESIDEGDGAWRFVLHEPARALAGAQAETVVDRWPVLEPAATEGRLF